MHYYQFNIADFALHTTHLTLEEEGVYRRLLDFYYDTEKPIPEETKQVIRRLRLIGYEHIVNSILNEFFYLDADGWHNNRADIEILAYHSRGDVSRKNGKKGGRPRKNNPAKTCQVILDNPDKTRKKANQELITNNQEPDIAPAKQSKKITLGKYLEQCKQSGVKAIPADHALFNYCEKQSLPEEFVFICWKRFVDYYRDGAGSKKLYTDWPGTFLNNVKNNYYKLWYLDDAGRYALTTAGKQAQREFAENA